MHIPLKTYLESIPGFFGIRLEEEPEFEIVQKENDEGIEIRRYVSTVQAQTVVETQSRDEAVDEGFRRLAGYIFGENSTEVEMSMTTPVLQTRTDKGAVGWLVSFILPKEVSVADAPAPEDSRVKIVTVEPKTLAVLRFTGNMTTEHMNEKAAELRTLLAKSGHTAGEQTLWAQYDQPFAIPALKRNEVMIEVDTKVDLAN
jgi:hypothetical protein